MSKTVARKTPLYDNVPVYSPMGELMFLTNNRRANWYIERGLAKDGDSPHSVGIHLTFEPNGRGHFGDAFYMQTLTNECASCGATQDLVRAHIVPRALRRFFPDSIKNHSHHDVLPLCLVCRKKWEASLQRFLNELATSRGVPINGQESVYTTTLSFDLRVKAKMAASALARYSAIPEARKAFLRGRLQDAYPELDPASPETWTFAMSLPRPTVEKPGSIIVKLIVGEAKDESAILRHLIMPLRAEFVRAMKPTSLPNHWSITREAP